MKEEKVVFFYPNFKKKYRVEDLSLENIDFFSCWEDLTLRAWIIQTYLQLKKIDLNVVISEQWPTEGIVVLLSNKESLKVLEDNIASLNKELIIVTIRADETQWSSMLSDIEVVQNGHFANNKDCFFIPHWPQPGIIKRDSKRGHVINNLVFKGGRGSMKDIFYSDEWFVELKNRNINFIQNTEHTTTDWFDYSEADIVIAVRPHLGDKFERSDKPASKLINSWHAGVPALLGKEIAYKELRRSDLDYLEIDTLSAGLKAIDFLKSNKKVYMDMIRNGTERAVEFSALNIANQWRLLLFNIIPALREEVSFKRSRLFQGKSRLLYYLFTKKQSMFEFEKRIGKIYKNMIKRYS